MLAIVISGEKMYIGDIKLEDVDKLSSLPMENALEIREILIPVADGQLQRAVNFSTISPFDKTPHTILINNVSAVVKLDETSDSIRAYDDFKTKLRVANSGIIPATGGANFDGKFGPVKGR